MEIRLRAGVASVAGVEDIESCHFPGQSSAQGAPAARMTVDASRHLCPFGCCPGQWAGGGPGCRLASGKAKRGLLRYGSRRHRYHSAGDAQGGRLAQSLGKYRGFAALRATCGCKDVIPAAVSLQAFQEAPRSTLMPLRSNGRCAAHPIRGIGCSSSGSYAAGRHAETGCRPVQVNQAQQALDAPRRLSEGRADRSFMDSPARVVASLRAGRVRVLQVGVSIRG